MLQRTYKGIKRFLLISPEHLELPDAGTWKLSVLRLIVLSGGLLTLAIVLHSSYTAYTEKLYYIIGLTVGFSIMLWGTLSFRKNKVCLAAGSLTLIIALAGCSMLLFNSDFEVGKYGLLFFFTLPIILRIFFGNKAAVFGMVLNVIPYFILIRNEPIPPLFGIEITLPETHAYLSTLVFLFFNFCLPVAVIRVLASLEKQSKLHLQHRIKLEQLVKQYQEIFDNGGTPSFFCDQHGRILQSNKTGQQLVPKSATDGVFLHQIFKLAKPFDAKDGNVATLLNNPHKVYRIQPASLKHHKKQLIHCFDISQAAAAGKKITALRQQHFTQHYSDALTQFKNHLYWFANFDEAKSSQRVFILLKLNNLKTINIHHGYACGDQALQEVAGILRNQLPNDVEIFRFPGSKFLLSVEQSHHCTRDIPRWLDKHLPLTWVFHDQATPRMHSLDWRVGFLKATSKYQAKQVIEACSIAVGQTSPQQSIVEYSNDSIRLIRQNSNHEEHIYKLIQTGNIELWLQPQMTDKQQLFGFEALARLRDTKAQRVLQPRDFVPQVEKNQWHVELSRQVLDRVITLIEAWPTNLSEVPLSINLSGPELLDDIFYEKLLRRYSESARLRERLKLELTETSVLSSLDETKKRLSSLATVGATIIIDDFGTGHASLSQLIDISASVLKIDRKFIEQITDSSRHRKIVKMTLSLANSLGMDAIAEGVETDAQLKLLQHMGFRKFQGFYFGKPQPIEIWQNQFKQA